MNSVNILSVYTPCQILKYETCQGFDVFLTFYRGSVSGTFIAVCEIFTIFHEFRSVKSGN